ncbi:hypothetical protein [Methanosarcina sp.]|uniref:hypothetical protein n=1 Tax=Methanosarcina sp. TaxID=2213 RepID=UPI002C552D80|nr:hypothetical protein [Methanosarcina sp.]HOW15056.1 hypothetical protein [Methanosarcina sp.]
MATGHATIKGRNGTSTSGKKVSVYSPQYSATTGKKAPDRETTSYEEAQVQMAAAQTEIKASSEGVTSYYTKLTNAQKKKRMEEYQARLKAGKTGRSQSTQHVKAYEDRNKHVASTKQTVSVTPLLDKSGKAIQQIQLGKGSSHIVGIRGVQYKTDAKGNPTDTKVISDTYRNKAYTYRQQTGKQLSMSSGLQASVGNAVQSYLSTASVEKVNKLNYYASLPITSGTNDWQKNKIKQARNFILNATPKNEKASVVAEYKRFDTDIQKYKQETGYSNKKIVGILTGKADSTTTTAFGAGTVGWNTKPVSTKGKTQPFKTVKQLKNEELDKNIAEFAGNNKIKAFIGDVYKVTSSVENMKDRSALKHEQWNSGHEKAISGKTLTWSQKPVNALTTLQNYTEKLVDDAKHPYLAIPENTVQMIEGVPAGLLKAADYGIQTKGKSLKPQAIDFVQSTIEFPFVVLGAGHRVLKPGGTKDFEALQTLSDASGMLLLGKAGIPATKKAVGVPLKATGRATGLIRDKTVLIKNQPYHPVGSQAAMIEAVTKADKISGTRATSVNYIYQPVQGSPMGIKTHINPITGNQFTWGRAVKKLQGLQEQTLTRYKEAGRIGDDAYAAPVHTSYMVPDLTKKHYEQVGGHFIDKHRALKFKQEIQLLEDIPTVASELTELHKKAISDYAKTGELDPKAFQDMQTRAEAKSKRIGQPVATVTPKTGAGFIKPELEVLLVYGNEMSTKITSSKTVGYTASGVRIKKLRFGTQEAVKNKLWMLENLQYNWKNFATGKGEYVKGMSEFANRKIAEEQGIALMKPNQYRKHGTSHTVPVETNIVKLWKASPELQKKYSLKEFRVAARLHDEMRIYGTSKAGETEPIAHGPAMAKAIRTGRIKDKELQALPKASQLRVAKAIETHMTIKPLSTKAPIQGLKTILTRPSDFQKALATADRLARAQEVGHLRKGMVFKLPEETAGFRAKNLLSDTANMRGFVSDTTAELLPKRTKLTGLKPQTRTAKQKKPSSARQSKDVVRDYEYSKKRSSYYSAIVPLTVASVPLQKLDYEYKKQKDSKYVVPVGSGYKKAGKAEYKSTGYTGKKSSKYTQKTDSYKPVSGSGYKRLPTSTKPATTGKSGYKPKTSDKKIIIPPIVRKKKSGETKDRQVRTFQKAHRTRKNTMGSFETLFGTSVRFKKPAKRKTIKNRTVKTKGRK